MIRKRAVPWIRAGLANSKSIMSGRLIVSCLRKNEEQVLGRRDVGVQAGALSDPGEVVLVCLDPCNPDTKQEFSRVCWQAPMQNYLILE